MPALTLLSIPLGIVVFVILIVAVSPFWVAAIIGLGVIAVFTVVDGLREWNRVNPYKGQRAY
jgi:hypothetical protein